MSPLPKGLPQKSRDLIWFSFDLTDASRLELMATAWMGKCTIDAILNESF